MASAPPIHIYPTSRRNRERFDFPGGREDYLKAKVKINGRKRFCQALEGCVSRAETWPRSGWSDFPWLTLVLGSGCLDLPNEPAFSAESIADRTAKALPKRLWHPGGKDPQRLTRDFARSLAVNRLRPRPSPSIREPDFQPGAADRHPEPLVDPTTAQLVYVAALLTEFFYLVRALEPAALGRWDDDRAVLELDQELPLWACDLERMTLDPAVAELDELIERFDVPTSAGTRAQLYEAVTPLLEEVRAELRPERRSRRPTLRLEHLRLVTEIAWHSLVAETSIYPGWTDLLLNLLLGDDSDVIRRSRRGRPRFQELATIAEKVSQLIEPATIESWNARKTKGQDGTARDALYAAAAEVLWEQARAGRRLCEDAKQNPSADAPSVPHAVAFVTSFDLELEMALWTQSREGETFSVAIPVHLIHESEPDMAELCWFIGDITPHTEKNETLKAWERRLDVLRTPKTWRLATPNLRDTELVGRPIVVHLSGCPLFNLPDLADEGTEAILSDLRRIEARMDPSPPRAVPAVTVDEYLSLRQAEAELVWSSDPSDDPDKRFSRALPTSFTHGADQADTRYWMAIGVPIADSAVRHRLAAHLTQRRMREQSFPTGRTSKWLPEAEHAVATGTRNDVEGIAVNLRVDDDEASLLYWLGLDVVEADGREFIDDLRHYAEHVRHDGPKKRPPPKSRCTLD